MLPLQYAIHIQHVQYVVFNDMYTDFIFMLIYFANQYLLILKFSSYTKEKGLFTVAKITILQLKQFQF